MANRRPIRSAFRKPFRFGRKRPVRWISEVWLSEAISLNRNDLNSFQLLKSDDWQASSTLITNKTLIKRVVGNWIPEFYAEPQESFQRAWTVSLLWMLWVVDADDTDLASIKSGVRGSPLQSARVLQTGVYGAHLIFQPDSGGAYNGLVTPIPPISVDWRGSAKVGPDDLLVFSISEHHTVNLPDSQADNLFQGSLSGWSRVLIAKP